MPPFQITTVPRDTTCTLLLHGEADLTVAEDIISAGNDILTDPATQTLIVDLEAITFMDSSAISALVRLCHIARDAGKNLQLTHIPHRVQRLLTITGLADTFERAPDSP